MVKSVNLGLKVKVLGPLLRIRGVGGHRYSIVYIDWGYCGWVGGPASLQAYKFRWVGGWARKQASARSAFQEKRQARREAAHNLH
jgi:hypothetical protein